MDGLEECFENLCNQVVIVAMQDLRRANNRLKKDPNNTMAQATHDECIRFFRSDWLHQYTEVDGEWLIRMTDKAQLKQYHFDVGKRKVKDPDKYRKRRKKEDG